MRLDGKSAFITGASRNIGRAIALAFAAEGADLVLNTRANGDELDAVAAECRKAGVRAVSVLGDIADAAVVERMVAQGLAELGAIDVLVCNAAIRPHKTIAETSLDEWHRVVSVNLHSALYLARAVAPGGASCTSDASCTGGSLCGLAQDGGSFTQTCGAPLGWWTADQICVINSGFGAPYNCGSTVQNSDGSTSTSAASCRCRC